MKEVIKEKWEIFYQKVGEVLPACLLMMVQGNVLAITGTHFVKALTTSSTTAFAMIVLSFIPSNKEYYRDKYLIAGVTAFVTMCVDFFVHPSHFGGLTGEAISTGLAAGVLCLIMSKFWKTEKK